MVHYKSFNNMSLLQIQRFDASLHSMFNLNSVESARSFESVRGLFLQMADRLVIESEETAMRGAIHRLYMNNLLTMKNYRVIYETIFFEAEEDWFITSLDYEIFCAFRHNLSVLLDNVM